MRCTEKEETALIVGLKTNDEAAFRQLYDGYWPQLYAVAYNRLREEMLAEDIVQEVFIDLWTKRNTLLIQHSLRAYLFASVKNKVLDCIRKRITRENFAQHILATTTDLNHTTDEQVACNELYQALNQQVAQLPNQRRLIFELSRHDQLSYAEIAQRLQLSPKTVENQLSRALKTLRRELRALLTLAILSGMLA